MPAVQELESTHNKRLRVFTDSEEAQLERESENHNRPNNRFIPENGKELEAHFFGRAAKKERTMIQYARTYNAQWQSSYKTFPLTFAECRSRIWKS